MLKLHKLLNSIFRDRDAIFLCSFWQELFKVQGITLRTSSARHPQLDGQSEVVNQGLKCYLMCMCGQFPTKWHNRLSLAEWWYNTTHHTTLNRSPYEVLYGVPPPTHVL